MQRFAAVLDAAGIPKDSVMSSPALSWARRMHDAPDFQPGARPAPRPPLAERPRHISLTRIETWLQDPYSIYARYILGLKKLDPLEKPLDAAERGTILHTILNNFTARWPDQLPADAASQLVAMARDTLQDYHEDPAVWGFWQPRFRRLAEKFIELETTWRRKAKFLRGEIKGSLSWQAPGGPFTITGTADRIDRMEDGGALIDYKSGGTYAPSAILSGKLPQLPLEALILESGGFADIGPLNIRSLSYWKLTGGRDPGEIIEIESALPEILSRTNDGLRNLVAVFDNEQTPYLNLPDAERLLRFNDYEHLARVREWATLGEDVDDGAEAA
jgi:ATP-dependent helicase/nuclease subunit B